MAPAIDGTIREVVPRGVVPRGVVTRGGRKVGYTKPECERAITYPRSQSRVAGV